MDHASELEVVPLSSGIDDIERLHKARAHPFSEKLDRKHIGTDNDKDLTIPDKCFSDSHKLRHFIRIIAPSIGFFGCQFAWACQGGYVDPYLRQLGLPDDMMNYAWILGPISGILFSLILLYISLHTLYGHYGVISSVCYPEICTFDLISECDPNGLQPTKWPIFRTDLPTDDRRVQ